MALLNVATKAAAIMATSVSLYDINSLGVREANIKRESNYADDFIAGEIGSSKLNYPSGKHAAFKNWSKNFKFPYQLTELWDTVSGYVIGAAKGAWYNAATLGFSALTFFAKKDGMKKFGAIGLGLSVAWDFIKNGTNLTERTDYLRKK